MEIILPVVEYFRNKTYNVKVIEKRRLYTVMAVGLMVISFLTACVEPTGAITPETSENKCVLDYPSPMGPKNGWLTVARDAGKNCGCEGSDVAFEAGNTPVQFNKRAGDLFQSTNSLDGVPWPANLVVTCPEPGSVAGNSKQVNQQGDWLNVMLEQAGFTDPNMAACIVQEESSQRPGAVNNDGEMSVGLFQINVTGDMWKSRCPGAGSQQECVQRLKEPGYNIKLAYRMYILSGKSFRTHWVTASESCKAP